MSKAKQQGTAHESWIVKGLADAGLKARRLAEGGSGDEGDVEAFLPTGRWVLEGKARSALNIQTALGKARSKAAAAAGASVPVAVVWKRLVRVPGKQTRQPVEGERVVVVLSWDDFVNLVQRAGGSSSDQ